jgi:hypothetical protein
MAKRPTIGDNPLDAYIAPSASNGVAVLEEETNRKLQQQTKSSKQRITVQISVDVIERLKNAVYWTPGLTLASLAEEAFSKAVDVLENEREAPFPKRKEELKTGRPLS